MSGHANIKPIYQCVNEKHTEENTEVSLIEEEVFETVREEEAGSAVKATPSKTSPYTQATQLRQRAGTWTHRRDIIDKHLLPHLHAFRLFL